MKLPNLSSHHLLDTVAPRAGAWIEIAIDLFLHGIIIVAPRAGAWIEMHCFIPVLSLICVAPRAGAWIEMTIN